MPINIAELKRKRAALLDKMSEIVAKAGDDEEMNKDDSDRFDHLEKCVKDHDERIERLEALNDQNADAAEPVEEPDENEEMAFEPVTKTAVRKSNIVIRSKPAIKPKPGMQAIRYMLGSAIARKEMSLNAGVRFVQDAFGDMEVAKVLNSTTAATGGALVPQSFLADLIPLLYARSTVRNIGPRVYPMQNGNLTIPRLYGGSSASYIGELDQMPVSFGSTDDLQLNARKLVVMSATTMDLVRRSAIAAEQMIRDDMVMQASLKEDINFLTGTGSGQTNGVGGAPVGLTSLAGTSMTMTGSITLSSVTNALRAMELSLIAANVPMDSVHWLWHPSVRMFLSTITDSVGYFVFAEELAKGTLFGYPFKESTQLPTNLGEDTNQTQILMVAASEVIIADSLDVLFDTSVEASYNISGTQYNAFQEDKLVLRVILEHDINIRHPLASCVNQVQAWSPSGYTTSGGAAYSTQSPNTQGSGAGSTQG